MSKPNETLHHELALSLIPQIGPAVYRNIIAYTGSAYNFLELPNGKASKIPRVNQKLLSLRKEKNAFLKKAEEILEMCAKKNIQVVTISDPQFPQRLKSIEDMPMVLFSKGFSDMNPKRTLGIVGTRNASEYGRNITRKIIEDVAPYNPTIISGLAYGIDIEAHKTALQFDLPTLAILGSSPDQIYPSIHKNTALAMLERGGLISEFMPGSEMHPTNFPKRNRIIAGLSDALIVVEAAKKGGALITAEIAYSYNKEVFAVPGNLQSTYSEGCNNLIRTMKASIFTGLKDLEEALSWSKENNSVEAKSKIESIQDLDETEKKIYEILDESKELEIDQLAFRMELPLSVLASKLLNMEFQGIIRAMPGKKYKIT
ncbi:DNA-processing protein DprA [Aquiflexum lacus]|uniref:DNA-processing protein DprA n=1 Tax=Aquiflexum lacus TaxID=2483805 RepID=UPI0018952A27|nr:DNA-processing protein DprA [Aquiflexum lacus]